MDRITISIWIRFVHLMGWLGTRHISNTYDRLHRGSIESGNTGSAHEFQLLHDAWHQLETSVIVQSNGG